MRGDIYQKLKDLQAKQISDALELISFSDVVNEYLAKAFTQKELVFHVLKKIT